MNDQYRETHRTWNSIAQQYEEKFMDFELYNDTYNSFCNKLNGLALLEIGCGPGNITRQLLKIKPELKILATDVAQNMLDLAGQNNSQINTQLLDARDLGILNTSFDGIVVGFVIPYLSKIDCAKFIADCSKLLVVGGVLYLSFVEGSQQQSGLISNSKGSKMYFYYHELQFVRKELESNKLTLIETIEKYYSKSDGTSEIHTILLVKKT